MEIKKSLSADLEGKKGTGLLMGFVLALSAMFVAFEWTQHDKKVIETEPVFTVAIEEDMIPITQQPEVVAPPPAAAPKIAEIINIVDNAVKYTPSGSHITISARKDGPWIRMEISDDGHGISDTAKGKLFDMFYTGETISADSRRGLGLGLSLCKSIIEAHGGTIYVRDNHPQGTVFGFTLQLEEVKFRVNHKSCGIRDSWCKIYGWHQRA